MNNLKYGYADAIINVGDEIGLEGYAHRFKQGLSNSGKLDDLMVRALNLTLGDTKLLILTVDVCVLSNKQAEEIRYAVSEKTGVPVEAVLLAASHTHSGPITFFIWGSQEDTTLMPNASQEHVQALNSRIKELLTVVAAEACCRLHSGKIFTTTFRVGLGYNRRHTKKDEEGNENTQLIFNIWGSPEVQPAGVVDQDIPVLMVERQMTEEEDAWMDPNGPQRVILFNVPLHPVVLGQFNRRISADYPGSACRWIEKTIGPGTRAMFILGACGDTHPWLATQENPLAVDVIGGVIGLGVSATLASRKSIKVEQLGASVTKIPGRNQNEPDVLVQIFRVGEAGIVGINAECFTQMGIDIRNGASFVQTLVASNANGWAGYLPMQEAYAQGGYEVEEALTVGNGHGRAEEVVRNILEILCK